jgi:hypothetical protein
LRAVDHRFGFVLDALRRRAWHRRGEMTMRRLLACSVFSLVSLLTRHAHADFKMHYPIVDYRDAELEHNGATSFDNRAGKNSDQSYTIELGYGVTPWWGPEIEFDMAAAPGGNWKYAATTFENTFQLTEQGEYWADLGFFAEYGHAAARTDADTVTFGPLVQKEWNDALGSGLDTLHTLNLFVSKQVGRNRNDANSYAASWQSRLRLNPWFQPGFEYYGDFNNVQARNTVTGPTHRAGPVVTGLVNFYRYGKIKYEAGYLFGLNDATERDTIRWRLEYEKAF